MGLLDCVASPEGRDRFDENERPMRRPKELSRSDHDISRRRGLPLFASQSSLKNVRDVDFWRQRVLNFLFSPEGRADIRALRVPFTQLGYDSVTDFISAIPQELFQEYQKQPPPDEGLLKEDKVFWVRDGIAEPGLFKWQGNIQNESCLGLQLVSVFIGNSLKFYNHRFCKDRKKAVPFGTYDGKGLFYCKPGHRAIVPEYEVIPYKKFLRGFLGVPPRKDSLLAFGDSVRLSARAIRAKNSKPGDRVFLPREGKWATVQWIGKIGNETVVDLIYERPKPQAGQPVSPDEACMSRSLSLADFIGELASEPNTPIGVQAPQENTLEKSAPDPPKPPSPKESQIEPPKSPLIGSQDHPHNSSEEDDDLTASSSDDDSDSEGDSEEGRDGNVLDSEEDYNSDFSEDAEKDKKVLPRAKEMDDMTKLSDDKMEVFVDIPSPKLPSPKRKGFFGFSPKHKNKSKSMPSVQKEKEAEEIRKSEAELQIIPKSPKTPRSKSPNIFANFRFKKNSPKQKKNLEDEMEIVELDPEIIEKPEKVNEKSKQKQSKPKGKSQWTGFFKRSKSKDSLSKLVIEQGEDLRPECETPVEKMIPPDKIPTPPPPSSKEQKDFNERRVERPDNFEIWPAPTPTNDQNQVVQVTLTKPTPPGPPPPPTEAPISREEIQRGEVRLDPDDEESDSFSETDEEESKAEVETTNVQLHNAPEPSGRRKSSSSDAIDDGKSPKYPEVGKTTDGLPIYLAICPPYIPPQKEPGDISDDEVKSPSTPPPPIPSSPPPLPSSPPPENGKDDDSDLNRATTPSSLEKFKDAKVRTRPSSFGSFLARIKNQKKVPGEVLRYPDEITPTSPSPPDENVGIKDDNEGGDDNQESLEKPKYTLEPKEDSDKETGQYESPDRADSGPKIIISKSLVKPKPSPKPDIINNEGDQEGIILDFLEVKESTPPQTTPPPVPSESQPKAKGKTFSFVFSKKNKKPSPQSQPHTPITPAPATPAEIRNSDENLNNENAENIEPTSDAEEKKKEKKGSSFRSSFRRTFSLTRKNKRQSSVDDEPTTPATPTSPTKSNIGRPRPVTLYIDNNDVVPPKQMRNSFRNKRPSSVVVDIKPWDMRHGRDGVDVYSSPSSDEPPNSPSMRSPNSALAPKGEIVEIPKHRIFTTPAFFHRRGRKSNDAPLITKAPKTQYKKFNLADNTDNESVPTEGKTTPPPPPKTPPPLPTSPPPELVKRPRPKSTSSFDAASSDGQEAKLKSALKQRKEIESIPKGLKINDRVLWYSSQGPIPGTVQRLFKDGTDKYTAMVKFDRDVKEAPLRLIREGDAYIITVEELITPDMFEPKPIYANQEELEKMKLATSQSPPITPSVRFNESGEESSSSDEDENERDLPPPFLQEEVQMACGFRRGIQCRDKSCCLESILFALFYTTNAFDIAMLYGNNTGEDSLTRNVRKILRKEIVDPLRRDGYTSCNAIQKLREAVQPLSEEWQTMSTDAEVMMFILFDQALKLGKFLSYSNGMSDFLHQLVVDPKDLSKSATIQHLFESSLHIMDSKLKLKTVPTPALILEMPRSNDKLMQYKAIIPNLSLHVSHLLHDGTRLCICGVVAQHECTLCSKNVGRMSIVYCDSCKGNAEMIHFQLPHEAQLSPLNQPLVILDLAAIICVNQGHYISFVKCGNERLSPWVYYDGEEIENPKVCIEQNLGMWLDRLEKYPGKYQDALQYPLLTHILQDSHICIYQPREKSSSV